MSGTIRGLPYLFVYGTLRRAAETEWSGILTAASTLLGMGRTRGTLFQLEGYPGMTAGSDGDAWVSGEVDLLHDPSALLASLDAYEGAEFERQVVTVLLDNGQIVKAWAYVYTRETKGRARIASGDYLAPGNARF
jgi:gamma-glutamylcyclotransferase (GGCT)/AIG2-like uncharacterized protein YtfP